MWARLPSCLENDMKQLIIAIKATLVLALLTGILYPLLVTGLAKV